MFIILNLFQCMNAIKLIGLSTLLSLQFIVFIKSYKTSLLVSDFFNCLALVLVRLIPQVHDLQDYLSDKLVHV